MRQIIACAFISLDGVIQAPGGPEEDRSGGFTLGGWMPALDDDEVGERIGGLFGRPFDLLLGRRTYDIFAAYWPFYDAGADADAIAGPFNRAAKYVLTGGDQPLDWENSHRLTGIEAVAALKQGDGPDLVIQGSGTLYPQLMAAGLIDRLTLMTFPVIIGSGKRLFGAGTQPGTVTLVEHVVTRGGTVIATYEPKGAVETGSFPGPDPSAAEMTRRSRIAAGTW